jgi:hypothetical protein
MLIVDSCREYNLERRQLQSRNLGRPGKPLAKIWASEIYYYYYYFVFFFNKRCCWLAAAGCCQPKVEQQMIQQPESEQIALRAGRSFYIYI